MLTFDLTSYRSLISGTYNYEGDATERDIVTIELTFEFSKDFDDIDYYELANLRGEFYAFTDYPANTAKVGCDTWEIERIILDLEFMVAIKLDLPMVVPPLMACCTINTTWHQMICTPMNIDP